MGLQLNLQLQQNPVADDVAAIVAAVRPILQGVLYGLKRDVADQAGGYEKLPLNMLGRLRRPGDGDTGVCFEYAVHDALKSGQPAVCERVNDALRKCNVPGNSLQSILFGAEKTGTISLIATAHSMLTRDSSLLYGTRGRPVKLKRHISGVATAFRKPTARAALPQSISGLWKADLFAGFSDTDKWIGTTIKIRRENLEGAKGLRVGIVPSDQGKTDRILRDDGKNLVVCPLPYDGSFVQTFYEAWAVVVTFFDADSHVPDERYLPTPASRQVARFLVERRHLPVPDVIEGLRPLAQPHLLDTKEGATDVVETRAGKDETTTTTILAPIPNQKA